MKPLAVAAALALVLVACAPKEDAGVAFVKSLYAPYASGAQGPAHDIFSDDLFTPEMKTILDRASTYSALLDEPVIDADPFIWAQDGDVKDLDVIAAAPASKDAETVTARFKNLGETREVRFALRQVDGHWRIDNISSGKDTLRDIVAAALAPAGDPVAMEAPVRAVYARYGAAGRYAPLYQLNALSASLRKRLEAASKGATQAPGFDPAIDAKRPAIGAVSYEPASSAVIVRFDNDGTPKLLAYDLVEENGAWRIADIRSPGQWTLTQKLADAGYPAAD